MFKKTLEFQQSQVFLGIFKKNQYYLTLFMSMSQHGVSHRTWQIICWGKFKFPVPLLQAT